MYASIFVRRALPNVPKSSVNTFAAGLGSASSFRRSFLQQQKHHNKCLHRVPVDYRTGRPEDRQHARCFHTACPTAAPHTAARRLAPATLPSSAAPRSMG